MDTTNTSKHFIQMRPNPEECDYFENQNEVENKKKNGKKAKKKHVCAKCGAGFSRAYDLKLHLRKHSDTRVKCTYCDVNFAKKDSLERHVANKHRHTELEVYIYCSICRQKYRRRVDLWKHMKKDHNIVLDRPKLKGPKQRKNAKKSDKMQTVSCSELLSATGIVKASGNLDHNSRSILKYLMQNSPVKSDHDKVLGSIMETDSINKVANVSPDNESDFNQGTVFVKKVRIENNGPLLGQRLLKSPSACLSTPEKDMMHIENSGSFSDIGDNYSLPKGITVTPFHVNKFTTANTLLPFEHGFSIGESKKYSLNFGLCPDPQLPENFMAESPENSLEGRISPNKSGYLSRERTPVKQLDPSGKVERESGMGFCNSTEISEKQRDIDVITIDSDSNISAKSLSQTVDSDVELFNFSEDEESKTKQQFCEKENLLDNFMSKKKRKYSDSEVSVSQSNQTQESNISIITYQAVSPMKIQKTLSQEKCNIGRKLLLSNEEISRREVGIDEEKYKNSHQGFEVSQGKNDTVKNIIDHTSSSSPHNVSLKTVSVSTSQIPPKITLFPSLQYQNNKHINVASAITVTAENRVSNYSVNGICQPVIFKSRDQKQICSDSNNVSELSKSVTYTSVSSQTNNISVKEVTLDKLGPSLFGKLEKNVSAISNNDHEHGNKVLVIGSNVNDKLSSVSSKFTNSGVVVSAELRHANDTINNFHVKKSLSGLNVSSTLDVQSHGTPKPTIIKNNYPTKTSSSENDHLDPSNLESFYHSQEVKKTLRSIVTQPCANELLRAKREKLTIDDIYEEKIAKLLDKIGLNTFKGVPISQYFSGSNSLPKRSHLSKDKMLGKDVKEMDPNQKLRHQEQIRARVASFIAMLDRNKKVRKPLLTKDQSKDSSFVGPQTETIVTSTITQPTAFVTSSPSDSPKQSVIIKDQSKVQPAAGVVFDGVFKVPTKCAPSIYGPRPVKVVIKNNLSGSNSVGTGIVTNCLGNLGLASLPLNHPVQTTVINNQIPTIAGITCNGIVNNLVGGVSIATLNLNQPLTNQVIYRQPINNQVLNPTSVLTQKVILSPCVNSVNKSSGNSQVSSGPINSHFVVNQSNIENTGILKENKSAFVSTKSAFDFKSSVLSIPSVSPTKTETAVSGIVKANIKPATAHQIQICSPLKVNTRVDGSLPAAVSKLDQLNISTDTVSPTPSSKLNPISPKSDSQQSLLEVDFLSGISSTYQQSLVSPTKLINGNSCSNDSISPIKEGSLLNIQDMNPAELQALMASPIKSFDMDNSNLSTASQNELLETLHNFLKDVPKSVSPQKVESESLSPKMSQHISPGKCNLDVTQNGRRSFDITNNTKEVMDTELISTSVNLTSLFSSETHKPQSQCLPSNTGGKFFKHITNNIQVSIAQPSCSTPSVSPSLNYYIPTSPSYMLSDESNQEVNDDQLPPDKLGPKCDGDDCDIDYVHKPLVVNAPELHDENTMDRIVSVVEDLKAYSQT